MPERDYIIELGGWQGYSSSTSGRFAAGKNGREEIWIELVPKTSSVMECCECGTVMDRVHDREERWIRDLPAWGADTWLLVHLRRGKCPRCGPRMEKVEWLQPYARVTTRLAEDVARLCEKMPIKQVAEYFGLSWHTVKRIHKKYLEEELGEPDLSGVTVIGLDEFALRKGRRYATVIVELSTGRVLWVCRGRSREDIRPFFEALGKTGREQIQAAAMDMWDAYEIEVCDQCPNAKIVYDLFHVVSKYGREVIDRVRVDEANRLKDDKPARKVVKGSKWLLLRNRKNLRTTDDRVRLRELLAANRHLSTVYILREDLKHLWDYKYTKAAKRFWKDWYSRAIRSRIGPLKKFARDLKKRLHGIFSHCRYPFNTSRIEGINNKIKVIKRVAYGFRDDNYFFLRIRSAFRGK